MAARSRFRKTVFENGLTLVSERHPEFRSLSIGFWVKVGTRHERAREAGVSHFLEHMVFKGTESRSALDIAREVDRVGGDFNAFTGREYTCFHILLLDRDLSLGMDILSDVVLNSNFDAEELERERKVILQEIAMVEESPEELAHDLFFEMVYGRHGLGRPILGTEASIRRMKRGDLLRFFRQQYRPDQLIISVAGDVSHETLTRRLRPLAKRNWPGRTKGARHLLVKPRVKTGSWWVQRDTEQVHLIWGVEAFPYASKDRFAEFVLNGYLGGGMSSALFQEIREKNGLAYTVYSSLSPHVDSGLFTVYAATNMAQVPLCLRLIEETMRKLKKDFLSEEELHLVKENLKGTILLSADSVESRMFSLAKSELFFGEQVTMDEVCERIDAVTAQDVRRVARKLLREENRSLLAVGPRPTRAVASKVKPKILRR